MSFGRASRSAARHSPVTWMTPARVTRTAQRADRDHVLLWMILLVGAIRPIQAFVRHETWGVESTVGLLMTVLAARALIVDALLGWTPRGRAKR